MSGWVGVDLDGTLAEYTGWVHETHIGKPIKPMVDRIRQWLAAGVEVRIFTARCSVSGRAGQTREEVIKYIQEWCQEHIGVILPVTNVKDFGLIQLWDDRAVRVVENTGHPCCDHGERE